jgi:hypothetical protein
MIHFLSVSPLFLQRAFLCQKETLVETRVAQTIATNAKKNKNRKR